MTKKIKNLQNQNKTTPASRCFAEPPVSAAPHERRKLFILCVLSAIIILLLWIFSLPYQFRKNKASGSGTASELWHQIKDAAGQTKRIKKIYK